VTANPYVVNLRGLVDVTPPSIASTGIVQTINTDTNAGSAKTLDMVISVQDASSVTQMVVSTFRDYGDYAAYYSNGVWHVDGLPLYKVPNVIEIVSIDELGNISTNVIEVGATDNLYNAMLRSGQLVTEIDFPDNLVPGTVTNVQWKVLSYVPVRAGILSKGIGTNTWSYFRNADYDGHTDTDWKIQGRPAREYAFTCAWPVPQKSGDFQLAFMHAQMDGALYMSAVIPDNVDPEDRLAAGQSKILERTIQAGGDESAPVGEAAFYVQEREFEFLSDYRRRSSGTISWLDVPTNMVAGVAANASWKVLSYVPVASSFQIVDASNSVVFATIGGVQQGAPVQSNWRFKVGSTWYYAGEYTFAATGFQVPTNAVGTNQIRFLIKDLSESNSSWMTGNIDADDDSPYQHKGFWGRFIERVSE
jgi:hypothetical protein